ncbi:COP9 signalosome complex subunit 6 [Aphelenchoides besseyi]|nr:COP9 signalosome complex subunit 6 [Aphelenchoides besseyi]
MEYDESDLTALIHPVSTMIISNHFTRSVLLKEGKYVQVVGALLGKQNARTVEIQNCFEVQTIEKDDGKYELNMEYFREREKMYLETFPQQTFLGFYVTGDHQSTDEFDVQLYQNAAEIIDSAILMKLNPTFTALSDKVPVNVFEANVDHHTGKISLSAVNVKIVSDTAEQIGTDHAAKFTASGDRNETTASKKLKEQAGALKMLWKGLSLAMDYVNKLEADPEVLRELHKLAIKLSFLRKNQIRSTGGASDVNDKLMVLLAMDNKVAGSIFSMITKLNVIVNEHANTHQTPIKGIFGSSILKTPNDFDQAVNDVVSDCRSLISEIVMPFEQRRIKKKTVALVDDVSNRICTVADLSDCVRNMHPDPSYVIAADKAMVRFTELVESLNTMPELYNSVKDSLNTEAHVLDELDKRTLRLFIDDFQQCGVHLEESKASSRLEFVNLSNAIFQFGAEFCVNAEGMTPIGRYIRHDSKQENILKDLVLSRHRLAQVTGFESYAHRAQQNTILGSYDAAVDFLYQVATKLRPLVTNELDQIRKLLVDNKRIAITDGLAEWDIETASYIRRKEIQKQHGDLSRFMSLRNLIFGFESLCSALYGLSFEVRTPHSDEIWPGYVLRLLDDATYQKPIVVLSLSLARHLGRGPLEAEKLMDLVNLSPHQAENFFHEMGHAIHSMLGATRYQHVADRSSNPATFTDECATAIYTSLNAFPSLNTLQQLHYSIFDLRLHGDQAHPIAVLNSLSTTDLYLEVGNELLPEVIRPRDFGAHHSLTHLSTYGAKYYSYVIAQACASLIWLKDFDANPFDSTSGALWGKIQSYGGERPSRELLNMTLGHELTADELSEALKCPK